MRDLKYLIAGIIASFLLLFGGILVGVDGVNIINLLMVNVGGLALGYVVAEADYWNRKNNK